MSQRQPALLLNGFPPSLVWVTVARCSRLKWSFKNPHYPHKGRCGRHWCRTTCSVVQMPMHKSGLSPAAQLSKPLKNARGEAGDCSVPVSLREVTSNSSDCTVLKAAAEQRGLWLETDALPTPPHRGLHSVSAQLGGMLGEGCEPLACQEAFFKSPYNAVLRPRSSESEWGANP